MVHLGCKGFNQEDTSLQRSINGLASTEQKCDGVALVFWVFIFFCSGVSPLLVQFAHIKVPKDGI